MFATTLRRLCTWRDCCTPTQAFQNNAIHAYDTIMAMNDNTAKLLDTGVTRVNKICHIVIETGSEPKIIDKKWIQILRCVNEILTSRRSPQYRSRTTRCGERSRFYFGWGKVITATAACSRFVGEIQVKPSLSCPHSYQIARQNCDTECLVGWHPEKFRVLHVARPIYHHARFSWSSGVSV